VSARDRWRLRHRHRRARRRRRRREQLLREAYPPQAFHALMNLISSHDVPRSLHLLGWTPAASPEAIALAKRRVRLAWLFQLTYPGAPTIYYGDEVGVTGGPDPDNRATYPWPDLGGEPDLSLKAEVQGLLAVRKAHPVLGQGRLLAPLLAQGHTLVLARQGSTGWALTGTNSGLEPSQAEVRLPAGAHQEGNLGPRLLQSPAEIPTKRAGAEAEDAHTEPFLSWVVI
jgi:glycosidase